MGLSRHDCAGSQELTTIEFPADKNVTMNRALSCLSLMCFGVFSTDCFARVNAADFHLVQCQFMISCESENNCAAFCKASPEKNADNMAFLMQHKHSGEPHLLLYYRKTDKETCDSINKQVKNHSGDLKLVHSVIAPHLQNGLSADFVKTLEATIRQDEFRDAFGRAMAGEDTCTPPSLGSIVKRVGEVVNSLNQQQLDNLKDYTHKNINAKFDAKRANVPGGEPLNRLPNKLIKSAIKSAK